MLPRMWIGMVGQFLANDAERLFVNLKTGRVEDFVPFENDAVIYPVQIDRDADKIFPGAAAVRAEPFHMAGRLNLLVLEKADEHQAVNDALCDLGKLGAVEIRIL